MQAIGSAFTAYVPNNAYIVLASGATALNIANMEGVQWIGRRASRHKVSLSLADEAATPRKSRAHKGTASKIRTSSSTAESLQAAPQQAMEEWERRNVISLHVTVHTVEDWNRAKTLDDGLEGLPNVKRDAESFAHRSQTELLALNVNILDAYRASDEKVVVRVRPAALRNTLEWLSGQPEVLWVEKKKQYYPLMSGATRLIIDGPSKQSETSVAPSITKLGINGTGQIIGVADTGLDWDSCFLWQSKNSPVYAKHGVAPPYQGVDAQRRKLISYNFHEDCRICDRCPLDVEGDSYIFATSMDILEAEKAVRKKYPEDESLSSIPPRNFDSAGATVQFKIQAVTLNVPSEYMAMGAGAFDLKVDIQIFIVPRADTDNFDVTNPDTSKCLNDCNRARGNLVEEELTVLTAQNGGYGVIIVNRGFAGDSTTVHAHVLLKGKIQFKTALKPCGDKGDDRIGHGTHTTSVAVGAADTPKLPEFVAQRAAASVNNGIAPGAKVYFEDVMQNDSPDCNIPGKVCAKVSDMTLPVDLARELFMKPYSAGARIHLNSWGCKFIRSGDKDERVGQCNKYTARSRDVDKFMYENEDFLVVFAAGETGLLDSEGGIAEPGTCKNCLTVGSANTFQFRYREAVRTRDPQADICAACQHPYFCSRSDMIGGVVMKGVERGAKVDEALSDLPSCCNDTIHEYKRFEDVEVPAQQWFTYHLPDMGWDNPSVSGKIRNAFKWSTKGASIIYDFKAKFSTIGAPSASEKEPGIQVFLLLREDFYEYFESGTFFCNDPETLPADKLSGNCRQNPCVTTVDAQNDGSEQCMARDRDPNDPARPMYVRVQNCESVRYDFMGGQSLDWTDDLCHKGYCQRLLEDSDIKEKDKGPIKSWGQIAADGCPKDLQGNPIAGKECCNDRFLTSMCINPPCTEINSRLQRLVRFSDITKLADKGFGIAVRNMNDRAIKLTGTVEIRNKQYPCTIADCCDALPGQPYAECCSKNYPRVFAAGEQCDQCTPVEKPGVCLPNEVNNIPSWSSRGPGRSGFQDDMKVNTGGRQFKPELVAPAIQIVSANSDGFVPSNGEPNDLEVQCGLPSRFSAGDLVGCSARDAERYVNTTAVRAQSGSSVAAALVAGAAALIRQYLADGYYPTGLKNTSNNMYANPPSALVKALLINSARSVQGSTDTYTYKVRPHSPVCRKIVFVTSSCFMFVLISLATIACQSSADACESV